MNYMKKLMTCLLTVILLFAVSVPAFAATSDTGFSDVAADSWYADSVQSVRDSGIMNGTSADTFSPNRTMTRAMLATTLYRMAGSPAVSGTDAFSDTAPDAYYANAVIWASANGIVSGYGNGLFGTNDPVSRQQIVTMLWRYAGSPTAAQVQPFADENTIASYATQAVGWAQANGVVSGRSGNRFDPNANATRAEVAVILNRYRNLNNGQTPDEESGRILVVYYSATGSTKAVGDTIAQALGADVLELQPVTPYTSADLDWTVDGSRVNAEHENTSLRDVKLTNAAVDNWDSYDTVFVGYPIWWGIAAWPVNDFITSNDFTEKTVIPFCTSSSSGIGQSGELLAELAGTGNWQEGQRFRSGASAEEVRTWALDLGLDTGN